MRGVNERFTGPSSRVGLSVTGLLAGIEGISRATRAWTGEAERPKQRRGADVKEEAGEHLKCDLGQKQKEEGDAAATTPSGAPMGGS